MAAVRRIFVRQERIYYILWYIYDYHNKQSYLILYKENLARSAQFIQSRMSLLIIAIRMSGHFYFKVCYRSIVYTVAMRYNSGIAWIAEQGLGKPAAYAFTCKVLPTVLVLKFQ